MQTKYRVVDLHTAGEPVRIIVEGYPQLTGRTILDKRREAQERHDHIRRRLMLEPRGHADMYGVIPVQPSDPAANLAVLFTHNSGYSTMCGHATLAIGRWAVESRRVALRRPVTSFNLECPCGLVEVQSRVEGETVRSVSFKSVPGFLFADDLEIEVPEIGALKLDIAYGGAFYAVLPASATGLNLFESTLGELVAAATAITDHIRAHVEIRHPDEPDLGFLYGTIFTDDEPADSPRPSYNVCVFGQSQVDRSPTGSGVTARMALDHAKGRLPLGAKREFRGVTGQSFFATLDTAARVGAHSAVRVVVEGSSYYSGSSDLIVEEADPLADGFQLLSSLPAGWGGRNKD